MVPSPPRSSVHELSFPHARGDGPQYTGRIAPAERFSPRPWGWSGGKQHDFCTRKVFPTPVGMVPTVTASVTGGVSFPHARGDGPCHHVPLVMTFAFSPRPWGWSPIQTVQAPRRAVFPTPVGMVPIAIAEGVPWFGFPHARGDGPGKRDVSCYFRTFSPRPWGWSGIRGGASMGGKVFPTPVGMVP